MRVIFSASCQIWSTEEATRRRKEENRRCQTTVRRRYRAASEAQNGSSDCRTTRYNEQEGQKINEGGYFLSSKIKQPYYAFRTERKSNSLYFRLRCSIRSMFALYPFLSLEYSYEKSVHSELLWDFNNLSNDCCKSVGKLCKRLFRPNLIIIFFSPWCEVMCNKSDLRRKEHRINVIHSLP